jgi:hypothetical protein
MDIFERYKEEVINSYLQLHPNVNPARVRELTEELIDKQKKDIPCVMHNNMTREVLETSVSSVFNWIEDRQPIIAGNATFFKQHEEYLPPIISMLETLQADRKRVKKEMWKFDKHSMDYVNRNTTQMSIKVIMNADYGGSGTPQSPFYSVYIPPATTQTAKNITTTLICCLEFSTGNNHPYAKCSSINELFDMIFIVLNDKEERSLIRDTFDPDTVAERLLSRVNNPTLDDMKLVCAYVRSLSNEQRTKLMLAFNIHYVCENYCRAEFTRISNYLKEHPVPYENLMSMSQEDAKEELLKDGFGTEVPSAIESDMKYVTKMILDNCIYPFILNDVETRAEEMQRLIVCVTDTDSLMVHFPHYIDAFQARVPNFKTSCMIASAIGMRIFIENIIPKFVHYVTEGYNIKDEYYRKKFVFKNEFTFLAMSLFKKKMYASSMFVQEGTPRDIHDIAVTGLSFKKRDSAEFLEPIMLELYDKYILTCDEINIEGLLDEYYALRDRLFVEARTNTAFYKALSIKTPEAYEKSKSLPAQMKGSIIWNELFSEEEILPMDRVLMVPLNKEAMLNSDNLRIQKILEVARRYDEKLKNTIHICLPESYKVIPEWLQPYVDMEVLVDKLLSPFKQILGLFDVTMADTRGGFLASRMLYI